MNDKRFTIKKSNRVEDGKFIDDSTGKLVFPTTKDASDLVMYEKGLNELNDENIDLKRNLKDCEKLKTKRLNKIRNHRAVIEDLGGSIRAYKGKLGQANEKIEKIKEAMENTGALTKGQLEEILND